MIPHGGDFLIAGRLEHRLVSRRNAHKPGLEMGLKEQSQYSGDKVQQGAHRLLDQFHGLRSSGG